MQSTVNSKQKRNFYENKKNNTTYRKYITEENRSHLRGKPISSQAHSEQDKKQHIGTMIRCDGRFKAAVETKKKNSAFIQLFSVPSCSNIRFPIVSYDIYNDSSAGYLMAEVGASVSRCLWRFFSRLAEWRNVRNELVRAYRRRR